MEGGSLVTMATRYQSVTVALQRYQSQGLSFLIFLCFMHITLLETLSESYSQLLDNGL